MLIGRDVMLWTIFLYNVRPNTTWCKSLMPYHIHHHHISLPTPCLRSFPPFRSWRDWWEKRTERFVLLLWKETLELLMFTRTIPILVDFLANQSWSRADDEAACSRCRVLSMAERVFVRLLISDDVDVTQQTATRSGSRECCWSSSIAPMQSGANKTCRSWSSAMIEWRIIAVWARPFLQHFQRGTELSKIVCWWYMRGVADIEVDENDRAECGMSM